MKLRPDESISNGTLHFHEEFVVTPKIDKTNESVKQTIVQIKEATGKQQKLVLRPRIEAIHVGRTRNNNIYPAEKLKGDMSTKPNPSGLHSFLYPYPKPMLKNHDTDTEPLGRIKNAQFVRDSLTGKEAIVIIPEITDPDAIEKILDGRYLTVSIGATTDSAICNICGQDIINEGWCEHEKGETYDGTVCGWIVGNLWFDECSFVNVPSDTDAGVRDTGEPQVMEAYAQVDEQYYDLTGDHGTATITESVATTLGLVGSQIESKGGLGTVSKPVTETTIATAELEALREKASASETLAGQITEKDNLIAEKDTAIAEKDTALATKDAQITEKDTQLQEKDAIISTLTEEKKALEGEKTTLESKVAELDIEKQALVDKNTEMAAKAQKDLAERVVDLKIALGKPGVENREEAIQTHIARGAESLSDSFKDLMSEVASGKKAPFIPSKVQNPGKGAIDGEPNATIEGADPKSDEDITLERMISNLLSGKYKK